MEIELSSVLLSFLISFHFLIYIIMCIQILADSAETDAATHTISDLREALPEVSYGCSQP